MTKFWMNTTSSTNWHTNPVGIIRVEKELSLRLEHQPFEISGEGFVRSESIPNTIKKNQSKMSSKPSVYHNKAQAFLLSARMLPRRKRLVKSLAYFVSSLYGLTSNLDRILDKVVYRSYITTRRIYFKLLEKKNPVIVRNPIKISSENSKDQKISSPFSDGDIILTCGLDWDNLVLEKIFIAKGHIDLRLVTVIYDLIPITNPEFIQNTRHVSRLIGHFTLAAQLSNLVLVNTQATAIEFKKFCSRLGLEAPEMRLIPWGVGFGQNIKSTQVSQLVPRIKTTGYFLAVGTLEIRKNYQLLVNIIRLAKEKNQVIPHFVFVGQPGWGTHELQIQIENDELLQNSITWLKSATDEQLQWLYQNCNALLSPSFGEGYGLPVAEAKYFGKKTYLSDIPVYRELFPKSTFNSPNDPAGWLSAITMDGVTIQETMQVTSWNESSKFVAETIGNYFGIKIDSRVV
jgi:glycosyltransferase involved in cell wall biosynthesis